MQLDDQDLIRQAQNGDSEAFCALAQTYARRLHSLALRYCRNSSDAEDLTQEVWLKAFRSLKSFRGESSFYTWLRQITINTFLSQKRYEASRPTVELDEMLDGYESNGFSADSFLSNASNGHASFAIDADEMLQNKILVDRVRGFLDDLTANQRLIFLLKHDEGMTCEEIATHLGCSSGTVKKSLFRTVNKLRVKLGVNVEAKT